MAEGEFVISNESALSLDRVDTQAALPQGILVLQGPESPRENGREPHAHF